MKKTSVIMTAAFVLAIGSAFTTKAFNPTGFTKDENGQVISAPTNEANCALNLTTNCSITVSGTTYSPVYDAAANIGITAKQLRHN